MPLSFNALALFISLLLFPISRSLSTAPAPPCPHILPLLSSRQVTPKIINGHPTPDFPSPPTLYLSSPLSPTSSTRLHCTAAQISPYHYLTAAHCKTNVSWIATPPSGPPLRILSVLPHPSYQASTDRRFDISLITLETPYLHSIPFLLNSNPLYPEDHSFIRVFGYGSSTLPSSRTLSPPSLPPLLHVDIPIVSFPLCKSAYDPILNVGFLDAKRQLCAGYMTSGGCDSCVGDSGGPLVQYTASGLAVLVALVSSGKDCAEPGFPGINLKVHPFRHWLYAALADNAHLVNQTAHAHQHLKPSTTSPPTTTLPSPSQITRHPTSTTAHVTNTPHLSNQTSTVSATATATPSGGASPIIPAEDGAATQGGTSASVSGVQVDGVESPSAPAAAPAAAVSVSVSVSSGGTGTATGTVVGVSVGPAAAAASAAPTPGGSGPPPPAQVAQQPGSEGGDDDELEASPQAATQTEEGESSLVAEISSAGNGFKLAGIVGGGLLGAVLVVGAVLGAVEIRGTSR